MRRLTYVADFGGGARLGRAGRVDGPRRGDRARSGRGGRLRLLCLVEKELGNLDVQPPVEVVVASQSASASLVTEAKTAALLVVGSRGLGGFVGQVMESVTQRRLHYSPCPLVIVPTSREQLAT